MDKDRFIRGYKEGDERKITALFNTIFNKARTLEQWEWEFKKNPEGFKVLVAEDDENLIAHLGALHRRIKIGQENAIASLEVDGMTHPDFARRGIFVALGKRLLSELERENIGIVLGFPNESALPGHRKLSCIELFTPPMMVRPLNFKKISKKLFANRFLSLLSEMFGRFAFGVVYKVKKARIQDDIFINSVSRFDERFDRFWEEASSPHSIILQRDSKYLNWRYAEHPEKHYQIFAAEREEQILAIVVVRVMELFGLRNGAILDVLALPNNENVAQALLQESVEHLKKKEVDLIACLIPKGGVYNRLLRKCGFARCPKRLNPKTEPFIIYPISRDIDINLIKNPSNWFITWGDTDVV